MIYLIVALLTYVLSFANASESKIFYTSAQEQQTQLLKTLTELQKSLPESWQKTGEIPTFQDQANEWRKAVYASPEIYSSFLKNKCAQMCYYGLSHLIAKQYPAPYLANFYQYFFGRDGIAERFNEKTTYADQQFLEDTNILSWILNSFPGNELLLLDHPYPQKATYPALREKVRFHCTVPDRGFAVILAPNGILPTDFILDQITQTPVIYPIALALPNNYVINKFITSPWVLFQNQCKQNYAHQSLIQLDAKRWKERLLPKIYDTFHETKLYYEHTRHHEAIWRLLLWEAPQLNPFENQTLTAQESILKMSAKDLLHGWCKHLIQKLPPKLNQTSWRLFLESLTSDLPPKAQIETKILSEIQHKDHVDQTRWFSVQPKNLQAQTMPAIYKVALTIPRTINPLETWGINVSFRTKQTSSSLVPEFNQKTYATRLVTGPIGHFIRHFGHFIDFLEWAIPGQMISFCEQYKLCQNDPHVFMNYYSAMLKHFLSSHIEHLETTSKRPLPRHENDASLMGNNSQQHFFAALLVSAVVYWFWKNLDFSWLKF